ncbi:hypothetical protein [Paenibacillus sp. FSL H8-0079]|uniref:hypothetical protein n=1 Tax=Paenibacillus sp. FSL H8-0079 TaxID=2921375 RepID=UPI0030EBD4F5
MNFLFWNIDRQSIDEAIVSATVENHINVLVIAEYKDSTRNLHELFLSEEYPMYEYNSLPGYERIKIFMSFPNGNVQRLADKRHYLALRLPHEELGYITLFAVHFFSKLWKGENDFTLKSANFYNEIISIEDRVKSKNTVLLGDFNMNPFEVGMIGAGRLHAFPTKYEANKIKRILDDDYYEMFYNPMWRFLGDEDTVPGTYLHASPNSDGLYWNLFDQVLVRPKLIERFSKLEILTYIKKEKLLDEKKILLSDHLPIKFSIN